MEYILGAIVLIWIMSALQGKNGVDDYCNSRVFLFF